MAAGGHTVSVVHDGLEAWDQVRQMGFDVVIVDWSLPGMDGIQLTQSIRSSQAEEYTYIMVLSASKQESLRAQAIKVGADDFVASPYDADDVMTRLEVAKRVTRITKDAKERTDQLQIMANYLHSANQRFTELFTGLPIAAAALDAQGLIREWNHAAEKLFGVTSVDVWEGEIGDAVVTADEHAPIEKILEEVSAGRTIENMELKLVRYDESQIVIMMSAFGLRNADGSMRGTIVTFTDITQLKELEREVEQQLRIVTSLNNELKDKSAELELLNENLKRVAASDGLTGIANRRHFVEQCGIAFEQAVQKQQPVSILILDVDHFKKYNDGFGHLAGDEVLRRVAHLMDQHSSPNVLPARYGGEEFVMLLMNHDVASAAKIAEEVRREIASYPWELRLVTASIGVATSEKGATALVDTLRTADEALYHSKESGRNQVTHYNSMPKSEAA